jgi:hypothetical protein
VAHRGRVLLHRPPEIRSAKFPRTLVPRLGRTTWRGTPTGRLSMDKQNVWRASVGDVIVLHARISTVATGTTSAGLDYTILRFAHRGADVQAWLWGSDIPLARGIESGDQVLMRAEVTELWGDGVFDLDILSVNRIPGPGEDLLSTDGGEIVLDLPHSIAAIVQRLLVQELASGASVTPSTEVEKLRGLALYLYDVLPDRHRTPLPRIPVLSKAQRYAA